MARITAGPRRLLSLILVAGLFAGLTGCAADDAPSLPAQPKPQSSFPTEISDRFDAALAQAMQFSGATGAIAGVWAPWAGSWESAPGTTATDGMKMSTAMHFRLGTNTTAMTCTVLLKLVDKKVVALDDPVSEYLPNEAGIDGMTLRQLCQNTGGIGDYRGALIGQFVNNSERVWPPLELLSNGLPLKRSGEPGAAYATSNTGFILVGLAIKAATGKNWQDLYKQYLLEPLGMSGTSYPGPEDLKIPGQHPHGYAYALGAKNALQCDALLDETSLSNSMYGVAGGMISTLDDTKHLVETVAGGKLLAPETSQAQWETVPVSEKAAEWQGYGLGVEQLGPLRGSAGEIPGFLSVMLNDPASGLSIVVVLNNSSAATSFVRYLGEQLAAIAVDAPATVSGAAEVPTLPWSEDDAVAGLMPLAVCQPKPEDEE